MLNEKNVNLLEQIVNITILIWIINILIKMNFSIAFILVFALIENFIILKIIKSKRHYIYSVFIHC